MHDFPGRPAERSCRRLAALVLCATCACLALVAGAPTDTSAAVPAAPQWDHALALNSSDGYVQLRWTVAEDSVLWVYQLQEGRRPVFADTDTRYEGPQHSSFVSGLEDGTNYFRVRARHPGHPDSWSEWSPTLEVEVLHHSRGFALTLMAIGGFVFLSTAAFLIAHRNDPTPAAEEGTR